MTDAVMADPAAQHTRPAVVVAGDNVFFSTQIAASLERLGYRPVVVGTAEAFRAGLAALPAAAILNLASRRFDAIAAIRQAKAAAARGVPLLGFCGHADTSRQEAARAAGCDLVTTNGIITTGLPKLLASLLAIPLRPDARIRSPHLPE